MVRTVLVICSCEWLDLSSLLRRQRAESPHEVLVDHEGGAGPR